MAKYYASITDKNNLEQVFPLLKFLRENPKFFERGIPKFHSQTDYNTGIKEGWENFKRNGDYYLIIPKGKLDKTNNGIEALSQPNQQETFKKKAKSHTTDNPVTTIHHFIELYSILKNSTKLILGTIHPHDIKNFLLNFFYGNVGSLWSLFSKAFPNLDFGNRDQIIKILNDHNVAISDIIRQCDRENGKVTEDSKLFNIVLNHDQILNGIINSKIDTIYFTSGFGKNNAAKLFQKTFKIKAVFDKSTREFTIPAKHFGREIRCVVLFSPSGAANRGIARSPLYLKDKSKFEGFKHPIAEFKRQFYQDKFSCFKKDTM